MKTTQYLYDCNITDLPNIDEGLQARIKKSKLLLNKLLDKPIKEQDIERIKAVYDAINFNQKLLNKEI